MNIPDKFKESISNFFYDKDIEIYSEETIEDEEGAVVNDGKSVLKDSFKGNFQYSTREKIKQEYGEKIEANVIVTCNQTSAEISDILVYNEKDYKIKAVIFYDSHTTILAEGDENV